MMREPVYRKEFTNALNLYLDLDNYKYSMYTDKIYEAIFHENSKECKQILQLEDRENPRDTMYSEVLKRIASFEIGIADKMKNISDELKRKLQPNELETLINDFSNNRFWIRQLENVRTKMACRGYGLRNIIHERLKPYIGSLKK